MKKGNYKNLSVSQYDLLSSELARLFFRVDEDSIRFITKRVCIENNKIPVSDLRLEVANRVFAIFATAKKLEITYMMSSVELCDVIDAVATYIESRFDIWS